MNTDERGFTWNKDVRLADIPPALLAIIEPVYNGRYLEVTPADEQYTGFTVDEMIGKRDTDLPWRNELLGYDTIAPEKVGLPDMITSWATTRMGHRKVISTRSPLDYAGTPAMFVTSHDVTQSDLYARWLLRISPDRRGIMLTAEFGEAMLTYNEFYALWAMQRNYTRSTIAERLSVSVGTVNWYTDQLKQKLKCTTLQAMYTTVSRIGLVHILCAEWAPPSPRDNGDGKLRLVDPTVGRQPLDPALCEEGQ